MRTALVQRLSLSQEEATEIIANALVKEGLEVSLADKCFSDITKITCLLVKDGIEYQFLHKSIQEYFSARFIRRLPEEKAQEFFRKILESPTRIEEFRRQLYFLYEIDSYRAYKYFALPSLDLAFSSDKEFGVDLRKAYCSDSLKTLFDIPILLEVFSTENISNTILQDAYKGAYRISVGSGIVIFWYIHKESADTRRQIRLAVLDHFDLLEILCTAVLNVINTLTEDKNGQALGRFSDSTYEASASDSLFTKQHSLPKVIMSLGLQDRVAQIIKSSDKWIKFQADVDDMIAMLERMDRADLLDII